jgi:NAD(P) transhydrogenase subunit alpha
VHISVLKETLRLERRVALSPGAVGKLVADGFEVSVEVGAGERAGFLDQQFGDVGANPVSAQEARSSSGVVVAVNRPDGSFAEGQTIIALLDPLWQPKETQILAEGGATLISLELVPRISRAQTMDVLSSMATVAGTEAVLLAARRLPKMFPLMMTAAGTVPAARVLVLGAGVAGLQAIATARRLGGVVEGYEVRPAAAEQIRSLGAKVVELEIETADSEDAGGYAKAQSEDVSARQQALLAQHVADADVVVTTAAIPGAPSPRLISTAMVEAMRPGSVIVDLAAERGGNCELTQPDDEVVHSWVTVLGPTDLASDAAQTASQMFGNNVATLIRHLTNEAGDLVLDLDDEITAGVVVAQRGEILNPRIREALA